MDLYFLSHGSAESLESGCIKYMHKPTSQTSQTSIDISPRSEREDGRFSNDIMADLS